ncbi:MAG: hypothetical protein IPL79_16820 [Myxococcales bacterium]|nr:hypothetical protein [Myxococcales bacterium]
MRALVRAVGITSVIAVPQGVLVAGQSAWSSMAHDARDPLLASAAMHAELGPAATLEKSRGTSVAELRDVLAETQLWLRDKAQYQRLPRDKTALSAAELAALEPIFTKQQPLLVDARAVADIRAAMALAREFGLRLVIVGGTEAWLVADELARADVAVIIDPQNILPGSINAPRVTINAAGKLRAAGVHVAFSTFDAAWSSVTLRQFAGIAIADGLAYDDALAALTTVPAAIYAPVVAARRGATGSSTARKLPSGTLEVGARADVVMWSGDPFEISTWAKVVIIGGVVQNTDTRQQELFRRYR